MILTTMQKIFGWIERVVICVAIIGFVLVLMSSLGGATIMVLSLAFLSLVYFAAGYFQPAQTGQKPSFKVALLKVLSGFTLSILVIGFLFKFMLWNGAAIMLLVGLIGTVIAAIAAFALTRVDYNVSGIIRRSAIWTGLGLVLFFTSSTTLFELHNPNDSVLVEKFSAREAHPGDPTYQADFDEYRRQHHSQHNEQ